MDDILVQDKITIHRRWFKELAIDCCILRIGEFRHYFITVGGDNEDKAADVPQAALERSAAAEEVKTEVKLTIWVGHSIILARRVVWVVVCCCCRCFCEK